MRVRPVTLIVGAVDAVAWLVIAVALFLSHSDPATKGLDFAAALFVTALYLVTGGSGLALALLGKAPRTALALALAFPATLLAALVVAVIALP